jgi:hypothetical protein
LWREGGLVEIDLDTGNKQPPDKQIVAATLVFDLIRRLSNALQSVHLRLISATLLLKPLYVLM